MAKSSVTVSQTDATGAHLKSGEAVITVHGITKRPSRAPEFRLYNQAQRRFLQPSGEFGDHASMLSPESVRYDEGAGTLEIFVGREVVASVEPSVWVTIEIPSLRIKSDINWPALIAGAGPRLPESPSGPFVAAPPSQSHSSATSTTEASIEAETDEATDEQGDDSEDDGEGRKTSEESGTGSTGGETGSSTHTGTGSGGAGTTVGGGDPQDDHPFGRNGHGLDDDKGSKGRTFAIAAAFVAGIATGIIVAWMIFGNTARVAEQDAPSPEAFETAQQDARQAEAAAEEARQRAQSAEAAAQAAQDEADQLERERDAAGEEADRQSERADAAEQEAAQQRQRAEAAEARAGPASEQVRSLEDKLDKMRNRAESAEESLAEAQDAAESLERERDAAKQAAQQAESALADAEAARRRAESEFEQAAEDNAQQADERVADSQAAERAAENRAAEAEARARDAQSAMEDAQDRAERAEAQIGDLERRIRELENSSDASPPDEFDMAAQSDLCENPGSLNRMMLNFSRDYERVETAPIFSGSIIRELTSKLCRSSEPVPCSDAFRQALGETAFEANRDQVAGACRF